MAEGMTRQDSRSSGHASMLLSMYGGASLDSIKMCDDNRETVQKCDDMIKSLIDDHEELHSSMDWSFLPPEKSKEPWPKTRHAIVLGSLIIVLKLLPLILFFCLFLFCFIFASVYIGFVFVFFLTKNIRVFWSKNR